MLELLQKIKIKNISLICCVNCWQVVSDSDEIRHQTPEDKPASPPVSKVQLPPNWFYLLHVFICILLWNK